MPTSVQTPVAAATSGTAVARSAFPPMYYDSVTHVVVEVPVEAAGEVAAKDGEPITLTAANANITKDINLHPPPASFRRLDIGYSLSCDHGDANPFNAHGVQTTDHFSDSRDVNPGMVTNSFSYTYDYNGGGYFHIDYLFSFALLEDLSVEVTVQGTMHDDGDGSVQDQYSLTPFNIPMGGTWSGWMSMEHDGFSYHNGPAVLNFSITNNQQSG